MFIPSSQKKRSLPTYLFTLPHPDQPGKQSQCEGYISCPKLCFWTKVDASTCRVKGGCGIEGISSFSLASLYLTHFTILELHTIFQNELLQMLS